MRSLGSLRKNVPDYGVLLCSAAAGVFGLIVWLIQFP
jgi:hypothetical protein